MPPHRSPVVTTALRGVPRHLYPFDPRLFPRGPTHISYLDEGPPDAHPVVMLHGNPTWSLSFRNLVLALRDRYRCLAPDHVGCGLSGKPRDNVYDYTLSSRVADLGAWLHHTVPGPTPITLVAHDWGGMIGMAWAVRNPGRVARVVLLNTAAFLLPRGKTFPWALRLARTPVGALAVLGANGFARVAARVCVRRRPLSAEVRRGYLAPYGTWGDRRATLRFVQDIPLSPGDPAYALVQETADLLHVLADRPVMFCWGMRDFVFDHHFLAEWVRRFPGAAVHRFPEAGHYVLEDESADVIRLVRGFLEEGAS
jgi:haloalkane dehalogenase